MFCVVLFLWLIILLFWSFCILWVDIVLVDVFVGICGVGLVVEVCCGGCVGLYVGGEVLIEDDVRCNGVVKGGFWIILWLERWVWRFWGFGVGGFRVGMYDWDGLMRWKGGVEVIGIEYNGCCNYSVLIVGCFELCNFFFYKGLLCFGFYGK